MAITVYLAVATLVVALFPQYTRGHGRLVDPPSRSSLWRFGFEVPEKAKNYNDNQLFCGGFQVQQQSGGKCGLCGDPFLVGPRDNEPGVPDGRGGKYGGKYANGIITGKYLGDEIPVRIHITANHKGWVEFRLCQHDNPLTNITEECLNRNLLADKDGVSRFKIPQELAKHYYYNLKIPNGLTCKACVLQWKYNTGISWGVDSENPNGCVGCGPQEQFYACADIAIGHAEVVVPEKNNPVTLPEGDVDERKWENTTSDAQTDTCNCPCKSGAKHLQISVFSVAIIAGACAIFNIFF